MFLLAFWFGFAWIVVYAIILVSRAIRPVGIIVPLALLIVGILYLANGLIAQGTGLLVLGAILMLAATNRIRVWNRIHM
jgi:hypothetical protein